MATYVAKFIPNMSDLTAPLREYVKVDSEKIEWNELQRRAFNDVNPLKVCHTKIDRMRSMSVCPLKSVVCRRMETKFPRKLPNVFLYAKLKSFRARGVHSQVLAEIGV